MSIANKSNKSKSTAGNSSYKRQFKQYNDGHVHFDAKSSGIFRTMLEREHKARATFEETKYFLKRSEPPMAINHNDPSEFLVDMPHSHPSTNSNTNNNAIDDPQHYLAIQASVDRDERSLDILKQKRIELNRKLRASSFLLSVDPLLREDCFRDVPSTTSLPKVAVLPRRARDLLVLSGMGFNVATTKETMSHIRRKL